MPTMDTDLFQVLALALLFLSLLSILAALSVLSGIKKRLDDTPSLGSSGATASSGYDYQAPATSYESAEASYEPTPSYQTAQAAPQAQEVSTGFVSLADAIPAAEPTATTSLTGGLRGDEPEEQPFERDGRWWFKRGSELLVYDEGTGQWVAAPAAGASSPAAVGGSAYTESAEVQTTVTSRVDTGEGWKCSSCGAVNGSTATTCRMCFAPR